MASPVADQYSGASGGSIVAGRSSVRPVLGVIGHSKVNYEITADSGYGMSGLAHHKWLNALLRKPFDYVRCNVPASTMGPGWTASNLVNGFYGRGGAPAVSVLGGTPPGVPTYIDQIEELVGDRPALICINAESNTLYAGTGNLAVALRQGSTPIAAWGPHAHTGAAQNFEQMLTTGQAAAITDYSDLRVVLTAS